MLKKAVIVLAAVLLVLAAINPVPASAEEGGAKGEWPSWRNDAGNAGVQEDPGMLTDAVDAGKVFIKGSVDRAPVFADINDDGADEIIMADAGRVAAVDAATGTDIWLSEVIFAQRVYAVQDLDGSGGPEVIVFGDKKLIVLSAQTGEVLYEEAFDEQLTEPRFKIGDFDKDGSQEAALWIYKKPYIYIYKFSSDGGEFKGERINRIVDTRTEDQGNIAAFFPGIAYANMDDDPYEELAIIRHAGIDLYDGYAVGTKPVAAEVRYEPLVFTQAVAESEYPGGGYPAANLIDGDITTYYISEPKSGEGITTGSGWVELDLGGPKYVSKVSVYYLHGCGFELQTFDPLQGWVTRASFSASDPHYSNDGEYRTDIDFGAYVPTDKIRIHVTSSSYGNGVDAYQVQFTEVKAYGDSQLPPLMPTKVPADQIASVTADSNYPGYAPELLINGDTTDYWISEQKPEAEEGMKGEAVIQLNLAKKKTIQALKFYNLIVPYASVEAWNIQSEQWEVLRTIDEPSPVQIGTVAFAAPVETNKLRIQIRKSTFGNGSGLYHVQLSEIELYELTTEIQVSAISAESEYPGGGYPVTNLIDGDIGTYFISSPKNEASGSTWVELELPEGTAVGSMELHALYAPDVQIQIMEDGAWQTKASLDTSQGPNPVTIDFNHAPLITDKLRLVVSGSSFGSPGAYHVQFTEVRLFKPIGGDTGGLTPEYSLDWIPAGAESGRNYGYFTLTNIDEDEYPEAIIVADGVSFHIGVADNDGTALSLMWDRYFGYAGQPSKADGLLRVMKVVNDPVADVDHDGKPEIVFGMFESAPGDPYGTWNLHVWNASDPDHPDNQKLTGYYLWGIEDVNGDGTLELLVTEESAERPSGQSPLLILSLNEQGLFEPIFESANSSFVLSEQPSDHNISAASYSGLMRPLLTDMNGDGQADLIIRSGAEYQVLGFNGSSVQLLAGFSAEYGTPYQAVKDAGGETLLLTDDGMGMLTALEPDGSVRWKRASGGPLDLIPIVADLDADGINEMAVPVGGEIHVYKLASTGAALLWKTAGSGKITPSFGASLVAADMDGDGTKEIIAEGSSDGKPVIKVIDHNGNAAWSYTFTTDTEGNPLGFTAGSIIDYLAADFTGDGAKDIFVALQNTYPTGRSAIIDGASRELLYVTDPAVQIAYAQHNGLVTDRAMLPMPGNAAAYDVDGDGADEIFFIALEAYVKLDYDRTSQSVSLDYYIAHISAQNTVIYYHTPIITDVDNDVWSVGPEHIMSGGFNSFSVFSNELPVPGQPLAHPAKLWHITMPVTEYNDDDTPKNLGDNDIMRRNQAVADADGDGVKEIALQYTTDDDRGDDRYRGFLYSYNAVNGQVEWTYDLKPEFGGGGVTARDMVAADIDGDGLQEFILTTNTGWVLAVNGESEAELAAKGLPRIQWRVFLGVSPGVPIIADADNDGFSDVLVPAADGYIHIIGKERPLAAVDAVTLSTYAQQPGTAQLVIATVETSGMPDGTPVRLEMESLDDDALPPAAAASGMVADHKAVIPLIVPSDVPEGNYVLTVYADSVIDRSATYAVAREAPPQTHAIVFENGTVTTYSAADLTANGTIETEGILFVPAGIAYQMPNTVAVHYAADQGIYFGAQLTTKAARSNIEMRSANGPIILDHAVLEASTGSNDIVLEAGTMLSAQGSRLITKNSGEVRLSARQGINLAGAEIRTGSIRAAIPDGAEWNAADADFHGGAPIVTILE